MFLTYNAAILCKNYVDPTDHEVHVCSNRTNPKMNAQIECDKEHIIGIHTVEIP